MPIKYRDIFNSQWFDEHTRQRENGYFEIRCTIDKRPITGTGKDLDTATERFIIALTRFDKEKKTGKANDKKAEKAERTVFIEFAEKWLIVVKKPTVKDISFNSTLTVYNVHIKPFFKRCYIDEITAMKIQPLFTKLHEQKKYKTATNVKLILNQIFNAAIAENLITANPMASVKVLKHKAKNGTALTYEEESEFLQNLNTSRFKLTFVLMLFCGMRRAELSSVKIDDNFVTVKNGKQRLAQEDTFRKIPITPMLRPFLNTALKKDLKEAVSHSCDTLSRAFKDLCPSHHLHELRHTFVTRCQECGVPREVVSVWVGHSADNTMTSNVYTHFSENFMISEGKKVDYYNRLRT